MWIFKFWWIRVVFFSVITSHNSKPVRSVNKIRLFLVLLLARWALLMISLNCCNNLCHCFVLWEVPSIHFQFINSSAHPLCHLPPKIPECFWERSFTVMVSIHKACSHIILALVHLKEISSLRLVYNWQTEWFVSLAL